ncbi:MAG: phosphoribosylaminoimidazolesuccinocarboxamide synthase, partial [candidate division WOR-3 bacterium]
MKDVLTQVDLPFLPLLKRGKVREVFDLGNQLLVVSTDRISAFDVVLNQGIPDKGRILNRLSCFWFNYTKGIVANHLITCDLK